MPLIGTKKTLNLHKYSLKFSEIMSNWKIILPMIFFIMGLVVGCFDGKGEGSLYFRITNYFTNVILNGEELTLGTSLLYYMIFPCAFIIIIFFLGLSVFGTFITNGVPFCLGYIIGCVSFYEYSMYTLKGFGYCVIMVYPYCILTLLAVILCCRESINMSQFIVGSISKTKVPNYSFTMYYKSFIKNFAFVAAASAVKTVLNYLFSGLFTFV